MAGATRATQHPGPSELARFLRGELTPPLAAPVVSHLLTGCERCRRSMAPLAALLLSPQTEPPEAPASSLSLYDFPLFRAFANIRRYAAFVESEQAEAARDHTLAAVPAPAPLTAVQRTARDRAQCHAFLEHAKSLRRSDPEGMQMAASLAVSVAERLEPHGLTPEEIADVQARAWSELGNARRLAGNLADAEADLARGIARADRGTGGKALLLDLMHLSASLFNDQERYPEAMRLLDCIELLHRAAGDLHAAGRALLKKGGAAGLALDHDRAIRLLTEALRLLDPRRDPQLVLMAVHNLLMFLVETGRAGEAARLFATARGLYASHAQDLDRLRVRLLEGRIAAGQGDDAGAEAAFKEVQAGFVSAHMPYDAAIVSLDLAGVWLRSGRTAEIQGLVDEIVAIFRSCQLRREAIGALLMLREACRRQDASAALLHSVTAELQRLQRDDGRR